MNAYGKIATGFVFAFGSFNVNGFDLLLDPVGWGLCVSGLDGLGRSMGEAAYRARSAAVLMVFVSIFELLGFFTRSDEDEGRISYVFGVLASVAAFVTVWMVAGAIVERLRPQGDLAGAALLDVLRWAVLGLGTLAVLAGSGYVVLGQVALIAWFAAIAALVIVLYAWARA
ncbi:hypothetical protein SAMN05444920_102892 [Nonomuraea solani]|uniref:Uncharacterized protein n=1 Tax=Nonomuraea solani TaxID=1144553 RepID=A0A1H5ZV36_9ACTN|nr:hypothetical protein [Nonomuraea solani]SEG40289.1 hypothetical protein SAMN05444920_102892 [Nonomuraea solani]